jgi:hypothetical protein
MARVITLIVMVVILVGAVLAATGVLRFENTKDGSTMTIDRKEMKDKTQDAVKKVEEAESKALDKSGDALHKVAQRLQRSVEGKNVPPMTPIDERTSTPKSDAGNRSPQTVKPNSDRQPSQ